jgi:RNA polymerase sigma factor (sigma-70 family)
MNMTEFSHDRILGECCCRIIKRLPWARVEDIEDQAGGALLRIFNDWDKYCHLSVDDYKRILNRIIINNLYDSFRKSAVEKRSEKDIEAYLYDKSDESEAEHILSAKVNWLHSQIMELTEEEYELIYEHYYNKLRFKEIGEKIGKSESAVRKQHERIIRKLRDSAKSSPPRKYRAIK